MDSQCFKEISLSASASRCAEKKGNIYCVSILKTLERSLEEFLKTV